MSKPYSRTALSYDKQWAKWQADFDRIYIETVYVFKGRMVFREVMKMFQDNPVLKGDGPGFVWEWLSGMYGRDKVLAIGREIDRDTRSVNLIQLMNQMTKRPRVVSRKRYFKMLGNAEPFIIDMNEKWFTDSWGSGPFLDVAKVKRDRNKLERKCKAVMKYRHRMVAHRSTDEVPLTFRQIHDAMDAVEEVLKKYHVLFTAKGLLQAEPSVMTPWRRTFDVAWRVKPTTAAIAGTLKK